MIVGSELVQVVREVRKMRAINDTERDPTADNEGDQSLVDLF